MIINTDDGKGKDVDCHSIGICDGCGVNCPIFIENQCEVKVDVIRDQHLNPYKKENKESCKECKFLGFKDDFSKYFKEDNYCTLHKVYIKVSNENWCPDHENNISSECGQRDIKFKCSSELSLRDSLKYFREKMGF